jgi:hypothetical protein
MIQHIKARRLRLNYNFSCDKIDHKHNDLLQLIWPFTLDTTDMASDNMYFQQI